MYVGKYLNYTHIRIKYSAERYSLWSYNTIIHMKLERKEIIWRMSDLKLLESHRTHSRWVYIPCNPLSDATRGFGMKRGWGCPPCAPCFFLSLVWGTLPHPYLGVGNIFLRCGGEGQQITPVTLYNGILLEASFNSNTKIKSLNFSFLTEAAGCPH